MDAKALWLIVGALAASTAAVANTGSSRYLPFTHTKNMWETQREITIESWLALIESTRRYRIEWYTRAKTIVDYEMGSIKIIATGQTERDATIHLNAAIRDSVETETVWADIVGLDGLPEGEPLAATERVPLNKKVIDDSVVVSKTLAFVSDHRVRRRDKYIDHINFYSRLHGLRPEFVTAVIDAESYFNPKAKSKAGALGLMQLVPSSGGRDAMRRSGRGDRNPTEAELYDSKTNIDLGTTYLKLLMDRYAFVRDPSAQEYLALAAYNWGMGNVDNSQGAIIYHFHSTEVARVLS